MASSRERKKDLDRDRLLGMSMSRGARSTVQIYKPGSGPLRKSNRQNNGEMDPLSVGEHRNPGGDRRNRNDDPPGERKLEAGPNERRRNRKPEQALFVPTVVAKARENEQQKLQTNKHDANSEWNMNGNNNNGGHDRLNANKSKRYSNRRRYNDGDGQEEWRNNSPSRNFRQGSEPRGQHPHPNHQNNWSRVRDTRSVEPQANSLNRPYHSEKAHMKPPSGRRHSTIGMEPDKLPKFGHNMEHIPPRFLKKLLNEGRISNHSEDSWDGSSITFQGSSQQLGINQSYNSNQHVTSNNEIYCTLPSRTRGRGRLQQEVSNPVGNYRSVTPDKMYVNSPANSRPATPSFSTRTRSNECLSRGDSRSQTPVDVFKQENQNRFGPSSRNRNESNRFEPVNEHRYEYRNNSYNIYNNDRETINEVPQKKVDQSTKNDNQKPRGFRESLEAQLSPVSPTPTTPEERAKESLISVNNDFLDWSEEVELHVKTLEAEALSDALTRSSSMTSLMETSTKSLPANTRNKQKKKKNRKKRSGSNQRDLSVENQNRHDDARNSRGTPNPVRRQRQNSHTSIDSRDNFKVPESRRRRRSSREKSFDRSSHPRNVSRESSFDRIRKSSCSEQENWREEMRNRQAPRDVTIKRNPEREHRESETRKIHSNESRRNLNETGDSIDVRRDSNDGRRGGLIHLPQPSKEAPKQPVLNIAERPKLPDVQTRKPKGQKILFDPNNPNTPIIINKPNTRGGCPGFAENTEQPPPLYNTDQQATPRPPWHNEQSDGWKSCKFPKLLADIRKADIELQTIMNSGNMLIYWVNVHHLRSFLMECLEYLLSKDIRFSQTENIEQYFWRLLYYNIIEMMRNAIANDKEHKEQYKTFLLNLIDEGTAYYESLLERLENTYAFKLADYLGANSNKKVAGYVSLALVSAQKIFICLGDLWRYREQVNETSNYGKCRQMYLKAHEINPKNGRPYNQLAVLALYSRKKLDAVYYYMRSLMSTNPVQSAKENLISLFDENRRKYEHGERKRREERQERARQHMKEKESHREQKSKLRTETWIHPDGGRRIRTTSAMPDEEAIDSEEDDLAKLSSVEVNKRFVTSYLHVHGKLITKIGMETFHETALQMLKEFRALLQHSPVPLPSTRFLHLLALNMFAIESTQLKDPNLQSGYRSELQERALVVSLQMFNLILEKCIILFEEYIKSCPDGTKPIPHDVHELLPSVKIWCDWMLCHTTIWNPPPSTQDFKVGPVGDAWSRLATLMNLLEKMGHAALPPLSPEPKEGFEQVRLPEDTALCGFTPLSVNEEEPSFVSKETDMELAQFSLRVSRLLFFGTIFLCGVEPPVLKLEYQDDFSEYVSVVCTSAGRSANNTPPEFNEAELLVECLSEEESVDEEVRMPSTDTTSEIQELLTRKVELEKRQRDQELHRQTVQKILQQSVVSVVIEVKPKNLVPDTNCFIDYLDMLKKIASSNTFTLMVPLIVLNELEGLAKGCKGPLANLHECVDVEHAAKVAEAAKQALYFLSSKHPGVKCITTKGTILTSTTFTKEDDALVDVNVSNDDRILSTCQTLCKNITSEQTMGEPRKIYREVVLLTEDRNLRVKALGSDMPVSEVPGFLKWASLG